MNRKIITRIIGITFTASALSFFPAMGMNLFQKATETAKKVTQAVVNTGAKAAAGAVVGVGKIAGAIENDCVELSDKIKQKIGDHERNKQSNIADSVDTILNTPINEVIDAPQAPMSAPEQKIQKTGWLFSENDSSDLNSTGSSSSSSSSDESNAKKSDARSNLIENTINAKLCSDAMLKLCCVICDEGYKGLHAKNKEKFLKSSKKLTEEAVRRVLKEKPRKYEFKVALLCLSLGVYNKEAYAGILDDFSINRRLQKYTITYQREVFFKTCRSLQKKVTSEDKSYDDIAARFLEYMISVGLIKTERRA